MSGGIDSCLTRSGEKISSVKRVISYNKQQCRKMKIVTVDMQGFNLPEFVVKEMAIFDGKRTAHFLFKPPKPWSCIDDQSVKNNIKYLQNNVHCLNYSSGNIDYEQLPDILQKYLLDEGVDRIYVKGAQKKTLLEEFLASSDIQIEIIATDWMQECPVMFSEKPLCMNHCIKSHTKKCKCSVNNCQILYNWIVSKLPNYFNMY